MVELEREGDVFVLRLDAGENRLGSEMCTRVDEALDRVEAAGSPAALVTVGSDRFYSNGLDLDEMMRDDGKDAERYLRRVLELIARVLTFPAPTVAAINGHAFGAGGQLAVGHDLRVMRADRGFFCMPEIDMRAPLHPFMTELLAARIPVPGAHEVIVTGRRYGGRDALERRIVDHAVPEDEVLPTALRAAAELAPKADRAMRLLKRGLYARVLAALDTPLAAVMAGER